MTKGDNGKFVEENNALMANGRAKPAEKTTLSTFIYNKREGKFLGRTGKSWAQIIVFYIIFYICLAAFWMACLGIFLKTIDPATPRYYGKGTIIGDSPGVGYQPWLKDDPESTLIKFDMNDNSSYTHYVNALNTYLEKYKNTNGTRTCSLSESNKDYINDGKAIPNAQACRFELNDFIKQGCGENNSYGFSEGAPCIILSLNRLIGWTPMPYSDGPPPEIKDRYNGSSIGFTCKGVTDIDDEFIGNPTYLPRTGIDGRYYPYAVMNNYHQPIAMVKFDKLPTNRVVMIECRAYAANIELDPDTRSGMVTFEILKQDSRKRGT